MGKTVTGVLRDTFIIGAIEVYEDSSNKAVRSHVLADEMEGDADVANSAFNSLSSQLQGQLDADEDEPGAFHLKAPKRKMEDGNDMMDVWGVSSVFGGS